MGLSGTVQPNIIEINSSLRLRKFDGKCELFLPGYQDPVVYQNSEGIFDEDKIPDIDYVEGMCAYLRNAGELYYIEVKENGTYRPIGDVAIKDENPPIAIWYADYRGKGIGTSVMRAVIQRHKELGFRKIKSYIYKWNIPSQKMHEKLGFVKICEKDDSFIYKLDLTR